MWLNMGKRNNDKKMVYIGIRIEEEKLRKLDKLVEEMNREVEEDRKRGKLIPDNFKWDRSKVIRAIIYEFLKDL